MPSSPRPTRETDRRRFRLPARSDAANPSTAALQVRKADKLRLRPEMTVWEAFVISVEASLEHLFANEALTLDGHPGGIHQSRVALRRQRTVLRAFKAALPRAGRKEFNHEFRWFQQRLGPARDWHVLLDETLPRMVEDGVEARRVEMLRELARPERRQAEREAAGALKSRRFANLLVEFEQWLTLLGDDDPEEQFDRELEPFARSALDQTRGDLLVDSRPLTKMSALELHALRIRGKNARYIQELFAALFDPRRTAEQLALLSRFQDRLGEINDASVAVQVVATLDDGKLAAELVRAVDEWSAERIRTCAREAQPSWQRLQGLEPFWRSPVSGR